MAVTRRAGHVGERVAEIARGERRIACGSAADEAQSVGGRALLPLVGVLQPADGALKLGALGAGDGRL